jgi:hypothetical protein
MKALFLVMTLCLSGCVQAPPVQTPVDALGQSISSIDAAALSVRSAELSGTITPQQALIAKGKLREAYTLAEKVRMDDPAVNPVAVPNQIHILISAVLAMLPETKP